MKWYALMKKTCPIWSDHISASNWLIGGEFSSFFTTVLNMMYPKDMKRDATAISRWFDEHTSIVQKRYTGRENNVSGSDFAPVSRKTRWYIRIRPQRKKRSGFEWQDYMFVSKSLVGCENIVYDESKEPPDDQEFQVVDKIQHAKSGYGLFFNRDFRKYECIGIYCGEFTKKSTLADTGYSIDWLKNRHYVIDAGGGVGYPMYFGWHFANSPEKPEDANVFVDDEMRVFCVKDVKKGDEAFFYYGERHDVVNNIIKKSQSAKHKKSKRKRI